MPLRAVTLQGADSQIKYADDVKSCAICKLCPTDCSMILTALSTPSMISMKKNSIDQKLEPGNVATASGYT